MGSPLFHQNPRFVSFISVCSLAQQRFDERVHKVKLISAKDSQKKLLKLLLMSKILVQAKMVPQVTLISDPVFMINQYLSYDLINLYFDWLVLIQRKMRGQMRLFTVDESILLRIPMLSHSLMHNNAVALALLNTTNYIQRASDMRPRVNRFALNCWLVDMDSTGCGANSSPPSKSSFTTNVYCSKPHLTLQG